MINYISYGKRRFGFMIIRRNRKTLGITVKPDKTIEVYAPINTGRKRIVEKVSKKARWIAKQIDFFEKNKAQLAPKEYVSGETHYFLGRNYRLRVRKSIYERVKTSGKFIYLFTNKNGDINHRKELLFEWYKWQAEKKFATILGDRLKRMKRYNVRMPQFYIKRMKTRWGSCSPKKGRINLNFELIKTPRECIEYIVDHELIHFVQRNHDKKYYELLKKINPDWKKMKEKLEKHIVQ